MPPGSPIDPTRHQKLGKHIKKYNKKKHGGGFARSAVRYSACVVLNKGEGAGGGAPDLNTDVPIKG